MAVDVKICGLRDPVALAAAVDGGARFVGFVFFPPSPRYVEASQVARLARGVPEGVDKVGLVVDAEDDAIGAILRSDEERHPEPSRRMPSQEHLRSSGMTA